MLTGKTLLKWVFSRRIIDLKVWNVNNNGREGSLWVFF
jgi:hypothetical protein